MFQLSGFYFKSRLAWTSKSAQMAQYPRIESTGSIGSIILGILEVPVIFQPRC